MKTILVLSIALVAILLTSCSKQEAEPDNGCYYRILLLDKYTADKKFAFRETWEENNCLSKYWWDKERAHADTADGRLRLCNPYFRNGVWVHYEVWRYSFYKNQIVQPIPNF